MKSQLKGIDEDFMLSIDFMQKLSNSFFKAYDTENMDVVLIIGKLIIEHIESANQKLLEIKMSNNEYKQIISLIYYYYGILLIDLKRKEEGIMCLVKAFEANKCCEVEKNQETAA